MTQPSPSTQNENVRASGECCQTAQHSLTESELASDVQILAALGSDTRYEVLRLIADTDGDSCVCELEPALDVSQSPSVRRSHGSTPPGSSPGARTGGGVTTLRRRERRRS